MLQRITCNVRVGGAGCHWRPVPISEVNDLNDGLSNECGSGPFNLLICRSKLPELIQSCCFRYLLETCSLFPIWAGIVCCVGNYATFHLLIYRFTISKNTQNSEVSDLPPTDCLGQCHLILVVIVKINEICRRKCNETYRYLHDDERVRRKLNGGHACDFQSGGYPCASLTPNLTGAVHHQFRDRRPGCLW